MINGYVEFISRALNTLSQGNVAALGALFAVLALGEFGVPFPYVLQGVLFFMRIHSVDYRLKLTQFIAEN